MTTDIVIPWSTPAFQFKDWADAAAWCVENFGLPGGKYETNMSDDGMIYKFNNADDALLFLLKWKI